LIFFMSRNLLKSEGIELNICTNDFLHIGALEEGHEGPLFPAASCSQD
jgi:hypothetical protein